MLSTAEKLVLNAGDSLALDTEEKGQLYQDDGADKEPLRVYNIKLQAKIKQDADNAYYYCLLHYRAFIETCFPRFGIIDQKNNQEDNNENVIEIEIKEVKRIQVGYGATAAINGIDRSIVLTEEQYKNILNTSIPKTENHTFVYSSAVHVRVTSPDFPQIRNAKNIVIDPIKGYTKSSAAPKIANALDGKFGLELLSELARQEKELADKPFSSLRFRSLRAELARVRTEYIKQSEDPVLSQACYDLSILYEELSYRRFPWSKPHEKAEDVQNCKEELIQVVRGEKKRSQFLRDLDLLMAGVTTNKELSEKLKNIKQKIQEDHSRRFVNLLNSDKPFDQAEASLFESVDKVQLFFGVEENNSNLKNVITKANEFLTNKAFKEKPYSDKEPFYNLCSQIFSEASCDVLDEELKELKQSITAIGAQIEKERQDEFWEPRIKEMDVLLKKDQYSNNDLDKIKEITERDDIERNKLELSKRPTYNPINDVAVWLIGRLNKFSKDPAKATLFSEFLAEGKLNQAESQNDVILNKELWNYLIEKDSGNQILNEDYTKACKAWLANHKEIDSLLDACEFLNTNKLMPDNEIQAYLSAEANKLIETITAVIDVLKSKPEEFNISEGTEALNKLNKIIENIDNFGEGAKATLNELKKAQFDALVANVRVILSEAGDKKSETIGYYKDFINAFNYGEHAEVIQKEIQSYEHAQELIALLNRSVLTKENLEVVSNKIKDNTEDENYKEQVNRVIDWLISNINTDNKIDIPEIFMPALQLSRDYLISSVQEDKKDKLKQALAHLFKSHINTLPDDSSGVSALLNLCVRLKNFSSVMPDNAIQDYLLKAANKAADKLQAVINLLKDGRESFNEKSLSEGVNVLNKLNKIIEKIDNFGTNHLSEDLIKLRKELFDALKVNIQDILINDVDNKEEVIEFCKDFITAFTSIYPQEVENFINALDRVTNYGDFRAHVENLIKLVKNLKKFKDNNDDKPNKLIKNIKKAGEACAFYPLFSLKVVNALRVEATQSPLLTQLLSSLADAFEASTNTFNFEQTINVFLKTCQEEVEKKNLKLTAVDMKIVQSIGDAQQKADILKIAILFILNTTVFDENVMQLMEAMKGFKEELKDYQDEGKNAEVILKSDEKDTSRSFRAELRGKLDILIKKGNYVAALALSELFQLKKYLTSEEDNNPNLTTSPTKTNRRRVALKGDEKEPTLDSKSSPKKEKVQTSLAFISYCEIIKESQDISKVAETILIAIQKAEWGENNDQLAKLLSSQYLEYLPDATTNAIKDVVVVQLNQFKNLCNSLKEVEDNEKAKLRSLILMMVDLINACREIAGFYNLPCLEELNKWLPIALFEAYEQVCEFLNEEKLLASNNVNRVGGDISTVSNNSMELNKQKELTKFPVEFILKFGSEEMKQALKEKFNYYQERYLLEDRTIERNQYEHALTVFEDSLPEAKKLLEIKKEEGLKEALAAIPLSQSLRTKVNRQYGELVKQILLKMEEFVTENSKQDFEKLHRRMVTCVNAFALDEPEMKEIIKKIAENYPQKNQSWSPLKRGATTNNNDVEQLNNYLNALKVIISNMEKIRAGEDDLDFMAELKSQKILSGSTEDECERSIISILNELEILNEDNKLIKQAEAEIAASKEEHDGDSKRILRVKEQYCLLKIEQIKELKEVPVEVQLAMAKELALILEPLKIALVDGYDKKLDENSEIIKICEMKIRIGVHLANSAFLSEKELEQLKLDLKELKKNESKWIKATMDKFFQDENKKESIFTYNSNFKQGKPGHSIASFVRDELELELASNPLNSASKSNVDNLKKIGYSLGASFVRALSHEPGKPDEKKPDQGGSREFTPLTYN
jgi:hypothetical protein